MEKNQVELLVFSTNRKKELLNQKRDTGKVDLKIQVRILMLKGLIAKRENHTRKS